MAGSVPPRGWVFMGLLALQFGLQPLIRAFASCPPRRFAPRGTLAGGPDRPAPLRRRRRRRRRRLPRLPALGRTVVHDQGAGDGDVVGGVVLGRERDGLVARAPG